jgi:glycosyltransferase involved in cell wall biosynthesis
VVVDDLNANGFQNVKLWSRGVDADIFHPQPSKRLNSAPPIFLYVGRVAVEKNVEAFLELELPGSKWVVGTGPALERIRNRFPQVNYLGLLDRDELAKVYAAADVFVFPSKTDTFGLVLLEAMACGLPVAAYPVTGPRDVIGDSKAGVLHDDLRTACLGALKLDRADALARAARTSEASAYTPAASRTHTKAGASMGSYA